MREVDQFLTPAGDKITLATDGTGGSWPAGPQTDVISERKRASLPPVPLPKSRHELNLSAGVWARDEASASRGSRSLQRTDLHVTSSCGDGETGQITSGRNELGPETTQEVDDRAVEIPAVRNVLEPTSNNLPTPHPKEREQARVK
jgi:hypothetical protein